MSLNFVQCRNYIVNSWFFHQLF